MRLAQNPGSIATISHHFLFILFQVRLLNQRWEQLRKRAMDTQGAIHTQLMTQQLHQLDLFRYLVHSKILQCSLNASGGQRARGIR